MRRCVVSLLSCLALLAMTPTTATPAWADGDPASDILLGQDVFYPYQPAVSHRLARALEAETAAAHRAGFPVKVALIGGRIDLGIVQQLFGRPQAYADFLEREISFNGPQPLLVVMAGGYGVQAVHAPATALAALPRPGPTNDDLARAALRAVRTLADGAGHPIAATRVAAAPGRTSPAVDAVIVAAVAVIVAAAVVVVRRRRAVAAHRRRPATR